MTSIYHETRVEPLTERLSFYVYSNFWSWIVSDDGCWSKRVEYRDFDKQLYYSCSELWNDVGTALGWLRQGTLFSRGDWSVIQRKQKLYKHLMETIYYVDICILGDTSFRIMKARAYSARPCRHRLDRLGHSDLLSEVTKNRSSLFLISAIPVSTTCFISQYTL